MYSIILLLTFLSIIYRYFCDFAQYIVIFLTISCITPYNYAKYDDKLDVIVNINTFILREINTLRYLYILYC